MTRESMAKEQQLTCWDCGSKDNLRICALCDAVYCPQHASPHDHPEPQSGPFRDSLIASRMSYSQWVTDTDAGFRWYQMNWTKP